MQLIFNGKTCIKEYIRLIENAKTSIRISTYIVKKDELTKKLFDLLDHKHKEGVKVSLIYDLFGSFAAIPFLRKYSWTQSYSRTLNRRLHAKILIVDDNTGIISGRNLANEYFYNWHDVSIFLNKQREITELKQFWNHIELGLPLANLVLKFTSEKQHEIYNIVVDKLQDAKKEVTIISPYFVIDTLLEYQIKAACDRGVIVTVITPLKMENGLMETFNRLNFHKVENENFRTYHTYSMFHTKMILIDNACIIGSANFDLRSFKINYEACALIEGEIVSEIRKHSAVLKEKIAQYSAFRRFCDRILEWIFRPIMPLL